MSVADGTVSDANRAKDVIRTKTAERSGRRRLFVLRFGIGAIGSESPRIDDKGLAAIRELGKRVARSRAAGVSICDGMSMPGVRVSISLATSGLEFDLGCRTAAVRKGAATQQSSYPCFSSDA